MGPARVPRPHQGDVIAFAPGKCHTYQKWLRSPEFGCPVRATALRCWRQSLLLPEPATKSSGSLRNVVKSGESQEVAKAESRLTVNDLGSIGQLHRQCLVKVLPIPRGPASNGHMSRWLRRLIVTHDSERNSGYVASGKVGSAKNVFPAAGCDFPIADQPNLCIRQRSYVEDGSLIIGAIG